MKANNSTIDQPKRTSKARVRRSAAAAVVGLLVLSACSSDPSARRVAQDIIEAEGLTNPNLDADCMRDALDDNFSADDLERIADLVNKSGADDQQEGRDGLEELDAVLAACGG